MEAGAQEGRMHFWNLRNDNPVYSRVHISSDTAFLKIVKKPSIVQE